jgi:hypothetical protein
MRISTNPADHGWSQKQDGYRVLVDGALVDGWITADDEEGHVLAVMRDVHGGLVYRGGAIAVRVMYGNVKIIDESLVVG